MFFRQTQRQRWFIGISGNSGRRRHYLHLEGGMKLLVFAVMSLLLLLIAVNIYTGRRRRPKSIQRYTEVNDSWREAAERNMNWLKERNEIKKEWPEQFEDYV
jgi:uncharacterized membrane protein